MQFSVLGPLAADDGNASVPLGGHRQRSVLALLLVDAGRVVSADRIITEIWGDEPPDGARASLHTYISNLRDALGRDRVVRTGDGYALETADGDTIDVVECETGLARARRLAGSDPAEAIDLIDAALRLWRGRPYEGFEDLPAVQPEVARLDEVRLHAREDRIDAELRAGGTPLVSDVEALRREHPYRERIWALLARTLYRAGRQAEAVRTFTRLRRLLGEELGLEPSPSIVRLEEQILLQDPALEPEAPPPPASLPTPISSFIGRVDELVLLDKALHDNRFVTVVAPGGAGKTRLAIEAANTVRESFPDGAWMIDLASVSDPGAVPQAAAAVMRIAEPSGTDPTDTLAKRLRSSTALIVLDNCEHVADAAGELAVRLLEAAPAVTILATSREALRRPGEVRFPLDGLATATSQDRASDAERLFEARAAAVLPGFSLDDSTRAAVSSICRHLDGMPLAIELAAARADVLSPGEIDRHLADRFLLLADERVERPAHRSLQASLDWSYDLLAPDEQQDFDALGIFEGPFSAAAAAAVLHTPSEVAAVDRIGRLVVASLVQTVTGAASHYRLLETTRMYARDRLIENGHWDDGLERHDRHYRDRCRELRPAFFGRERPAAQAVIVAELADYHAAFDRFIDDGRVDDALDMAWPLGHVWLFTGRLGEGARRLAAVIDASDGDDGPARADVLTAAAFLGMYVTDYEAAIRWTDEACRIYRSTGDEQGLAYALARRGHLAFSVGDVPTALELLQESLEICRRIDYDDGTAWPITLLAQARLWTGDESPEVQAMFEEGRERFITMGETFGQAHCDMFLTNLGDGSVEHNLRCSLEMMELAQRPDADPLTRPIAFHNLAFAVWYAGEHDRADGLNRAASRAAIETGSTINSGMAYLQAGLFAAMRGDAERGAILLGAGDAYFQMQLPPFYERQLQPGIDAAIDALGAAAYGRLHGAGAAMSTGEAAALLESG